MKQKKIGNTLYVYDTTPYEITEGTDAAVIKIQEELIPAYAVLNPTLVSKFSPINYNLLCVKNPVWADYMNDYSVTVNATTHGTVTVSDDSADPGETITITVTPDENYELNTLTVFGPSGKPVTVTDNAFKMPTGNVTISATFRPVAFTITDASTNGTVYTFVNAQNTTNPRFGDTVTLRYCPNDGYELSGVTVMAGDVPVTVTDQSFTMPPSNVTITANYTEISDYSTEYFSIKNVHTSNNPIDIRPGADKEYDISTDNGITWTHAIGNSQYSYNLLPNEVLSIKSTGDSFHYSDLTASKTGVFKSNYNVDVYGNIMSLLYGANFANQTAFPSGSTAIFKGLFSQPSSGNFKIVNANNLILPATTLVDECYRSMFDKSQQLEKAPALPATTLASACYRSMFYQCTKLTDAPVLPATTLVQDCYRVIFSGCTLIDKITCLATDISATDCTYSWLANVAATGTFTKDANMTDWTTGNSGIPSDWTTADYAGQ